MTITPLDTCGVVQLKGEKYRKILQWEYAARGGCNDPYYPYPWCNSSIDCISIIKFLRPY
jgi:hypothetical protein